MGSISQFDHIHDDVYEPLSPSLTRTRTQAAANPVQPDPDAIRVAVVGGGIGGLCLALGLFQNPRLNVQIYEAAHKFSEIGAGIGVGPNAEKALEMLGPHVYAAYAKQSTKCPFLMRNGQAEGELAGEVLTPKDLNASQSTIHRANFLDALVDLVPHERAHFGKRLVHMEDKTSEGGCITLHFKDETTAEADVVMGADGIHSPTRDYVLAEEPDKDKYGPTYTGVTAYRNLIPMEQALASLGSEIAQKSIVFVLDHGMVLSYPVDHNQMLNAICYTWQYTEWTRKEWVIPVDTSEVLDSVHGQNEEITKILKLFNKASAWALWDLPSIPRYNRNRVCIIGDAAHATTPFQGQGAGQAIEDGLTLTRLMAAIKSVEDVPAAFAAYDTVRRPRGNKNVTTSRETGRIGSLQDPDHTDLKEIGESFAPRMMWLWTKDQEEQCQEAIHLFEEYNKNKA